MANLYELTAKQAEIEELLEAAGGELTPELERELNASSESLTTKVDNYANIFRKADAQLEAIDAEIKRLQTLKKTRQNAVKSLKEYILYAMDANGVTKIDGTLMKLSVRRTKAVEIGDEEALTGMAWQALSSLKVPAWINFEVKINKTELKRMLEEGEPIVGAEIKENRSLIIK